MAVVNASIDANSAAISDPSSGHFACGGGGTCSWNMGSYTSDYSSLSGVGLTLTTSNNLPGAEWVQTYIATGDPYDNDSATSGHWNQDVLGDAWSSVYTGYGASSNTFADTPGRPIGTSGIWVAQTSLIQPDGSGGYNTVATFTWGFAVSTTGQITQFRPIPVSPNGAQLQAIGGASW